ncbi:MAG: selenium-dependent xanthine dehydrogenase [Chloroflexota bacterium]|nr:selenium-dependent xanthine dehydrogenase [Chloroflexota bacterium]MDE2908645.1 selenium-dependent xanthine dehydrogenase [Chloroflexota bacterium]
MIRFNLNGKTVQYDGDPERALMNVLREDLGIISPKDGCAPQAACGCCVVGVDDKALLSCVTKMSKVEGKSVTTTEGLGEYRQNVFADSFVKEGGVQCGFCIPGIVMQANNLINHNPDPSRADIEKCLTPHLCRCTGYKKIVTAIENAADAIRNEEEIEMPDVGGGIGTRLPKYQAQDLVLGQHRYVDDIRIDGMRIGALKFSDHPRAVIKSMDLSAARSHPGALRVFTAEDVPGDRYIGLIKQDWPLMIAVGETTRYLGDVLAIVVAESDAIAREAVALIEVDYDVLEPVTDMHAAMLEDSPSIHEGGNVLSQSITNRGDLGQSMAASAYTTQGVYETQMIEHGFMEPEACVSYPHPPAPSPEQREGGGIEVLSQGQGVFEDRVQIAKLLGLPQEDVHVVLVANGGAFGGKEDLSVQGHAALAAYLMGEPVKVRLTRDESIVMHPKRHPIWMEYTIGCDEDGMLTFCKGRFVGDTGAYASVGMKVLERSAGHATGAYNFPVTDIVSTAVYTNNLPCGAMRGFGVNQTAFALESCIDDLCEQGGFDRWQFRYQNALDDGDMTATGQVIEAGAGAKATLEAVKDEFNNAKFAGIACGIKNTGIGNGMPDSSKVTLSVVPNPAAEAGEENAKVIIDHGWTEMGQGVHTMAVQALVTETGIPPSMIEVRVETSSEMVTGMTTASRATSLIGNAIIDACKRFKADLEYHKLEELVGRQYEGEFTVDWTTKPGAMVEKIYTHYSYSYATQLVVLDEDGQLEKIVAAHDAGKIFNPTLFEGQLEGSIHMGLGYAISEDLPMEGGRPKSTMLRKCGILRAKDMPEMEVIGVEVPDPYGPYGAKGVGEIGLVPTAGAVANALYQFDGVRRHKLPMRLPRKRPARRPQANGGNGKR